MKTLFWRLAPAGLLAALGGLSQPLDAAGDGWLTDFEAAKKTASAQKKDLLVDFTGSDWCGWCIRLDKEVFAEEAFKSEAPKHFVFVSLDFPQKKELPEDTKQQNERLQKEFKVEGFPTIFLTDATGKPYAKTGYQPGGAANYLKHLAELRKARETRDTALVAAGKASGLEKAKHLKAALDALDAEVAGSFYGSTADEIIKLDNGDTLGMKRKREKQKLEEEIGALSQERKADEIIKRADDFIAEKKLAGAEKQEVLFMKLNAFPPPSGIDQADKLMDEVIAVDAETPLGARAKQIKARIAEMRKQQDAPKDDPKAEKKAE